MLTTEDKEALKLMSGFFKTSDSLEAQIQILENTHSLWLENLKNIKEIKYIMFCEAPPFDENGSIDNYIYNREGEAKGMYLKAPYRALKGEEDEYPSKEEMIDFLNEQGMLFIDILPLSIDYSSKRRNLMYAEYTKYFWDDKADFDYDLKDFMVSKRLADLKSKLSDDVRICFSHKSVWKILNDSDIKSISVENFVLRIDNEKLIAQNSSGNPDINEITVALNTPVSSNTSSLKEEMIAVHTCYLTFFFTTKTDGGILMETFFKMHPRFNNLNETEGNELRSEAYKQFKDLKSIEKYYKFNECLKYIKGTQEATNLLLGFDLLRHHDKSGEAITIMLDTLDELIYSHESNNQSSIFSKELLAASSGSSRNRLWIDMLLRGFELENIEHFFSFYSQIAENSNLTLSNSINQLSLVSKYESILSHLDGFSFENPKNILKEIFKSYQGSQYRWVRETTSSCPIYSANEIAEFSKEADRYTLKGCLTNPNCPEDLKAIIKTKLEDENKYPIETNEFKLIHDYNVLSAIELKYGICDGTDLIEPLLVGDTFHIADTILEEFMPYEHFNADMRTNSFQIDNNPSIPIELDKVKDHVIELEVSNGEFAYAVEISYYTNESITDWTNYSLKSESFINPKNILTHRTKVKIADLNYTFIEAYSIDIDKEKVFLDENENDDTTRNETDVHLFFGHNNKWIKICHEKIFDHIYEEDIELESKEDLIKLIKELYNLN